jgi:hypothetical protein
MRILRICHNIRYYRPEVRISPRRIFMTIPSDNSQAIRHLAQTSATEARTDNDIVQDGRPAILLSGNTQSQCLRMAVYLRAIGHRVISCSSTNELQDFIREGPELSLAVLDLTHFAIQDVPVLEQLAERLNERGLILWSTRLFRPELDRAIQGGVFVHV